MSDGGSLHVGRHISLASLRGMVNYCNVGFGDSGRAEP